MKKVAKIFFDEGSSYKRYEMAIFKNTKITIKGLHEKSEEIVFEGAIEELLRKLWIEK